MRIRAEEKMEYQEFFQKKLKEHNVSSPSELDEDEKKKFFDEIETEWTGEKEASVEQRVAERLVTIAEALVGKKGEVPEAFKKQWKKKDKDGDGKENEKMPEGLKEHFEKKKKGADTFKCPECGTKVLEKTGFCVKCKKKVKKSSRAAVAERLVSLAESLVSERD